MSGFAVAILGTLAVVLFLYVGKGDKDPFLPVKLGEMKLARHLGGEAAQGMIDHLHGKAVTPLESFIGFYEDNGAQATLYVSVYANASEATDVDRKMGQRIRTGNPVFRDIKDISVAGQAISECIGMGQIHYFFSRDAVLYWIGVDPPVAQQTLESLLHQIGNMSKSNQ